MKKRAIILGAGPAGISAAWHLAKEGFDVSLLERADGVGGFGASVEWKGHILDYGPHAFHIKPGRIVPLVESLFNEGLLRKSTNIRTLTNGRYLKYPFEFYNFLTHLSPFLVLRMVFDFLIANLIYKFIHVSDDNFESWGIKRFGKTLYNFCFGHYTQKVWGVPSRLISPKFAAKKIKTLSLKNIVSKILGGKGEEHEIYWEKYLYPEKGSGELFKRIQKQIEDLGGRVYLGADVKGLQHNGDRVTAVKFMQNGKEHSLEADLVVSTIALRSLVLKMNPPFSDYISYTAKKLHFRAIIFVYFVLETDRVSDALWIYLLDPRFKFNRVTEQKNLSSKVCPNGKTVLCFEICCNTNDPLWSSSDEQLKQMALDDIKAISLVEAAKITDCFVKKMDEAYAVCHLNYDQHLRDLLEHLANFRNLLSTGRQGLYLQNDMHDSMEMGIAAAEFFSGNRRDSLAWYQEQTSSFIDWVT